MTTKTIECIECGESVPYGRLSCPSCGMLLASVSGQRARAVEITEVPAAVEPTPDDDAPLSLAVEDEPPAVDAAAVPVAAAKPAAKPAAARASISRRGGAAALSAASAEPAAATAKPVAKPPVIEPLFAVEPDPEPKSDEAPTAWAPIEEPAVPVLVARPYTRSSADSGPGILASLPSAYRPSTLSIAAAATGGGASWSAAAGSAPSAPYPATTDAAGTAGGASTKDVVDVARFAEISGWFVVVGASMSILGFLLPWSVTVIGSRSFGGYFGSWGLASPTHVLVLLGLLALLALGVLHTPVPEWIKTGILGLAMGGLLIGLVWPYVVGPLGADVGVLITALGGILLVIGGAVASWATRHVEADSPV